MLNVICYNLNMIFKFYWVIVINNESYINADNSITLLILIFMNFIYVNTLSYYLNVLYLMYQD
jgi:hypothetical protein